jgi:CSLREA domain-containing protein
MNAVKDFAIRVACFTCLGAASTIAQAAQIFTVNSTLDEPDSDPTDGLCLTASGTCTLRAAITQSNYALFGAIVEVPAGIYVLTLPAVNDDDPSSGDLDIINRVSTSPGLIVAGAGADQTIIDGNGTDRVFNVAGGQTVSIIGLTVRNGNAVEINGLGGGIINEGDLFLSHVVVADNTAFDGGGILSSGSLEVLDTSLLRNHALDSGGGIFNDFGSALKVENSTIAYNTADAFSSTESGAGLRNVGTLIMINATVAANTSLKNGGGISQTDQSGTANLYNVTVAYNEADSDGDSTGIGGGLYITGGSFNVYNSIVAGNIRLQPGIEDNCDGNLNTHAYNRFGIGFQCAITQVSGAYATLNTSEGNYLIGALADNGGPTQTIALLPGSNAVDGAIQNCLDENSSPILTDQREFRRNIGICDIGAYEYQAIDPNDVIFRNGFE